MDGKGCGVKGFSGEVGQASFYMELSEQCVQFSMIYRVSEFKSRSFCCPCYMLLLSTFHLETYLLQAEEQFTARNYFDDAEKL